MTHCRVITGLFFPPSRFCFFMELLILCVCLCLCLKHQNLDLYYPEHIAEVLHFRLLSNSD